MCDCDNGGEVLREMSKMLKLSKVTATATIHRCCGLVEFARGWIEAPLPRGRGRGSCGSRLCDRIRNRRPRIRLFAPAGRVVRLSEDWAQAMGAGKERPAGGEGHDSKPVRHSCWRTRRHLRRQQPRPLQIRGCRTELEGSGPPLARARACRWRGGACLSSGVIWKDVLRSCPYAGSKSITFN